MLHEYHVIYIIQYYLEIHITTVFLGTYYLRIQGLYCIVIRTHLNSVTSTHYIRHNLYKSCALLTYNEPRKHKTI
jgi:hypothetical protein